MPQITVSLETAKKMQEAGWSKKCAYSFCDVQPYWVNLVYKWSKGIPAQMFEEILDELPTYITIDGRELWLEILVYGEPKIYRVRYENCWDGDEKDSLAEAAAACYMDAKEYWYI